MSEQLDNLGIRYEVEQTTETVEVDGQEIAKDFVVTTLALTTPPKIQASFTHESAGKKFVKFFKKEIQVGDSSFDDVVYVSTDTPEETTAFLESKDIQKTILNAVAGGGSVEIHERKIVARIPGTDTGDDRALASLVRVVLKA